ncbi:MAG: S49 family peptidase [Oscillatoriaceae cyanobacterium Prado104]|jgi:protease-4|nr:S49 family peptidase [Oscillatoriaceae cyanobacterium Prado104]
MKPFLKYTLAGVVGLLIGLSFLSCGRQTGGIQSETELTYKFISGEKDSQNRLLEIQINGPILNSSSDAFGFPGTIAYGYEIERLLERASKDDKIKGVFLRLSTPGGTIVGSNAVFEALKRYRETTKKPVVAYIDGLSASGGVMSMVGADVVYAAPGSLIGSIGVVGAQLIYYDTPTAIDNGILGGGITTRNGIQQTIISAGRSKDIGNPFRKPTEEELRVLRQGTIAEYNNFVDRVAQARKIDPKLIRDKMGALLFDNKTAQQFKLIDGTKNQKDAIADLANRAQVGKNFQLIRVEQRTDILAGLLGAQTTPSQEAMQATAQRDLCAVVTSRLPMVYYGNVNRLCPQKLEH